MFVLEFEKPLFEFEYATPHCNPLLALPPTFSNSTIYYLLCLCGVSSRKKRTPLRLFIVLSF